MAITFEEVVQATIKLLAQIELLKQENLALRAQLDSKQLAQPK